MSAIDMPEWSDNESLGSVGEQAWSFVSTRASIGDESSSGEEDEAKEYTPLYLGEVNDCYCFIEFMSFDDDNSFKIFFDDTTEFHELAELFEEREGIDLTDYVLRWGMVDNSPRVSTHGLIGDVVVQGQCLYARPAYVNHVFFDGDVACELFPSDIDLGVSDIIERAVGPLLDSSDTNDPDYNHYTLEVAGMEMEAEFRMGDYVHSIGNLDTYALIYHPPADIYVKLEFEEGKVSTMTVYGTDTVGDVKNQIAHVRENLEPDDIRFTTRNDDLDDNEQFRDILTGDDNPFFYAKIRARGGGKSTEKKKEQSLVKKVLVKQKTKQEEYAETCDKLNDDIQAMGGSCEVLKDAKAGVKHFNSLSETNSHQVMTTGINTLDLEAVKRCLAVCDPRNRSHNGGESRMEYVVKQMFGRIIQKLEEHEKEVKLTKSALVLSVMKHGVNLSKSSSKVDLSSMKAMLEDRERRLTAPPARPSPQDKDGDIAMETLTDLFGRTKM
ncbi:unnamed protein product [Effrenium voratum]|nr:unnamed protein product [Effrenium voratum]